MENHFNTVVVGGARENFEHLFDRVDSAFAGVHSRLLEHRNTKQIGAADWLNLTDGVAAQLLRTKLYRTTLIAVGENLARAFAKCGPVEPPVERIDEQTARASARDAVLEREKIRVSIASKRLLLIEPEVGGEFWVSDNPVVQHNTLAYGDLGLNARGIEIYFPVARDLVLGFFCPTIAARVSKARALGDRLDEPLKSQCADLDEAFVTGRPTQLSAKGASAFLNELQVRYASRFIYSAQNDFSLVTTILIADPSVRNVQSLIEGGMLGEASSCRSSMPSGLYLVVLGHEDNYMLPIDEIDAGHTWGFDVLVHDGRTVEAMIKDQPWDQVRVYQDGRERRAMRRIRGEAVREAARWRVKIRQDLEILAAQ